MESTTPQACKLQSVFSMNGTQLNITVYLNSVFPRVYFTADSLVLDASGFTVRQLSLSADTVNMCRGIAMLDRVMDVQDNELTADAIILPHNNFKCHKQYNVECLAQIEAMYQLGYIVKNSNISVHKGDENSECPVCMDTGKPSTKIVCGHVFCLSCIQNILMTENLPKCPLCRSELAIV
jgi:hypothetical protein